MEDKKYTIEENYEAVKNIEKNTKYPKVFIGIVTSVHKMYCLPQFMKGLKGINYPNYEVMIVDNSPDDTAMNFCRSMRELGHTVIHMDRVKFTRENLTKSRNMLIDYFLKHNKENPDDQFEYFFSLESDVIPAPDCIQELLKNQVNVVSGVYMNGKVYPPKEGQNHELHTWIPMAWQYPEDGIPELNVLRPMDILKDIVPSRLIRVQSSGVGFLLISKHVIKKLKKLGSFKVELDSVACFRKGTKIFTTKGYNNIENVVEGDEVWTHNDRWKKVSASGKTRDYTGTMITFITDKEKFLTVTSDHECFINNEIIKAKDVKLNDKIKTKEGTGFITKIIKEEVIDEPVFNLTIIDDHSIMTDAFVVKNCDDMYFHMDITKMCDNPDCDYIGEKYIHECPKCKSHCVWSYLDTKVWALHLHNEWGADLRKFR